MRRPVSRSTSARSKSTKESSGAGNGPSLSAVISMSPTVRRTHLLQLDACLGDHLFPGRDVARKTPLLRLRPTAEHAEIGLGELRAHLRPLEHLDHLTRKSLDHRPRRADR